MALRIRNDPFSDPQSDDKVVSEDSGSLVIFARILAFLFAVVLSWILYRVVVGAYRQYQHNGVRSLFDGRRGTYRRVSGLRIFQPGGHAEENDESQGYRDHEDSREEVAVEFNGLLSPSGKGKGKVVEVVDEGYHDSETSFEIEWRSPSLNADVWKELPDKPLPDKPLPAVPR